jgi:cytochrome b561
MQPVNSSATQYDKRTIVFHWLTAILVVVQWLGSKTFDLFPKGPLQVDTISAHITLGIVIGLLVLSRIWWRATNGARLPDVGSGILPLLAKAMHWGLYLLILAVVGLGLTMISLRSFSFFNLFSLPTIGTATRPFLRSVHGIHELLANVILIAAGLHAIIAIVHQYAWRDGVLARMVPRLAAR